MVNTLIKLVNSKLALTNNPDYAIASAETPSLTAFNTTTFYEVTENSYYYESEESVNNGGYFTVKPLINELETTFLETINELVNNIDLRFKKVRGQPIYKAGASFTYTINPNYSAVLTVARGGKTTSFIISPA